MGSLDDLAARCGIQESSLDVFGKEHKTTPELKRALLKAMGFEADEDEQAARALQQLDAREWERPLPPVIVAYVGERENHNPVEVPVVLPSGTSTLRWRLELEDGSNLTGEAQFPQLRLVESCQRDGRTLERRTLALRHQIPWGYHRLRLDSQPGQMTLIATPGACWLPPEADERRLWGVAINLYQLRSERNWGIGDFTDLHQIVDTLNRHEADTVGLNPLHAMFPDKPEDASPYSPSDRLLLNVLNIDLEAIPEFAQADRAQALFRSEEFRQKLNACRDSDLVDYRGVADLKLAMLPLIFEAFEQNADRSRREELETFHQERRELLDRACLFQALRAHFAAQDPPLTDCAMWPQEFQRFDSPAVKRFAQEHPDLIRYQLWLQWVADSQLKAAAEPARSMAVGLYRDLAVGAHPTGAEVWTHPDALVAGAHVGAPPDILNTAGQDWGLPPLNPIVAREQAYASFTELVRANMRYAGALRIDHALALKRLYWIPQGNNPQDGAYVHYPTDDLIGILALESQRNRCIVIGEALGTVPKGLDERLAEARILSYRVLFFEVEKPEDEGNKPEPGTERFLAPQEYPYLGLAVASNHDLATVNGWWESSDLDLRERLGLFPKGSEDARKERANSRESLVRALKDQDLIGRNIYGAADLDVHQYSQAVHRFLARTNCLLTLIQMDDITAELEQVNVPGTSHEHTNWRKRTPLTLKQLAQDPRLATFAEAIREERRSVRHSESEAPVAAG